MGGQRGGVKPKKDDSLVGALLSRVVYPFGRVFFSRPCNCFECLDKHSHPMTLW